MTSFVVSKVIGGGVLKLERVQVICPACGQQVEAVATDGRVKGYCAAAKQNVDFPVTQGMAVPVGSQANAVASVTAATAVHTGKNLTAEHKAKISAALTGKHLTAETRAKISAANQGKHGKGKPLTAEHKAKMSVARAGKHPTVETRAKISAALRRRHNKKGVKKG